MHSCTGSLHFTSWQLRHGVSLTIKKDFGEYAAQFSLRAAPEKIVSDFTPNACTKTNTVPFSGVAKMPSVMKEDYQYFGPASTPLPTPVNDGTGQVITATSTYTLDIVRVYLYTGHSVTGTVSAEIQGVTAGVDSLGNSISIPDGIVKSGGISTNSIDAATLTLGAWTPVIFNFPGVAITSGEQYSFVFRSDNYYIGIYLATTSSYYSSTEPKDLIMTWPPSPPMKSGRTTYTVYGY